MYYQKVYGSNFNSPEKLAKIKEYNFTSTQTYVFWKDIEPEYGKFDFSKYDDEVERVKKAGLKWVPFILLGPRYAAPKWRLESENFKPLMCIEHGKECPIESIWNPELKTHITRVLKAIQEHYGPMDVIESVQPGICGDYGEAIYPCDNGWPGAYHGHQGYWCGDPLAIADYQKYIKEKYKTIDALNEAYEKYYKDFSEVKPKLAHQCNRVAFFDMVNWYKKSMTDFADFWLMECKRVFGNDMPVYLCTGGWEEPFLGADFAQQARICAKNNCGIRLTNEASKFYDNFSITVHGWTACKYYGAYYGLEPAGYITYKGYSARLFGTMAYGSEQFHTYDIFDKDLNMRFSDKDWEFFNKNVKSFEMGKTIGLFYPLDQSIFTNKVPDKLNETLKALRHNFPVSTICETMILDGALDNIETLFIINAQWTRKEVIDKIVEWAKTKGKILFSNVALKDIYLNDVPEFNALFGINENSEYCIGRSGAKIVQTEGFDNLNELEEISSTNCYKNLDDDIIPIAYSESKIGKVPEGYCQELQPDIYTIFMKKTNNCKCIMYVGDDLLVEDPEYLRPTHLEFLRILKDVAKQAGVPYFDLKEGEIAKADYFGKELVLSEDGISIK